MENAELDFEHVIQKNVNGCRLSLYFTKQANSKLKDTVIDILMDSFENRVQNTVLP